MYMLTSYKGVWFRTKWREDMGRVGFISLQKIWQSRIHRAQSVHVWTTYMYLRWGNETCVLIILWVVIICRSSLFN